MKTLLVTAAALALMGAPVAFAQQGDQHDHHESGGHNQHEPGPRGPGGSRWGNLFSQPRDLQSGRFRSFERNIHAQRRFHIGVYAWPRGLSYHRFSYGQFLPDVFFGPNYFIYDYGDYGLPYPPPGCVWVRYGPDALLVDRNTGEIIQVIYGIFY